MPIYGYECTQCGHQLEVLQSVNDEPLRTCPECMGPLRKMLYPVGVIFKGSGFYSTDYKGSSNGKSSERSGSGDGGGDSKPSGESKAEKKSDSKPAAE
jgi:putative FmdB family regulatory protein